MSLGSTAKTHKKRAGGAYKTAMHQGHNASVEVNKAQKLKPGSPGYQKRCAAAIQHLVEAAMAAGEYQAELQGQSRKKVKTDYRSDVMEEVMGTEAHVAEFCTGGARSGHKKGKK